MTELVSEAAGAVQGRTPPLPYYTDAAIWENDIAWAAYRHELRA